MAATRTASCASHSLFGGTAHASRSTISSPTGVLRSRGLATLLPRKRHATTLASSAQAHWSQGNESNFFSPSLSRRAVRSHALSAASIPFPAAHQGTGSVLDVSPSDYAPLSDDPSIVQPVPLPFSSPPPSTAAYKPVPALTPTQTLRIYRQLAKSRLTVLVVLTSMAGYALCPTTAASSVSTLLALTAGTALCSAAANATNQLVEAPYDAQMPRTRARPLPARNISHLHAASFAAVAGVSGVGLLWTAVNPLTATLGAANVVLYAFCYTPLKRLSISNTWLGALVGALPPLMGWSACTGTLDPATQPGAWALAALLFAWQFPHFNALAQTLRAEYARGGYRMMAVTDPALNRRVSLRYALALLPICSAALPLSGAVAPLTYALLSAIPNAALIHAAWRFWSKGDDPSARYCFWVSLLQLPAVMLLAMACKAGMWERMAQMMGLQSEDEVEPLKS